MDKSQAILQQLKALFESQRLGVLSTHRSGQPYASLVAYCAGDDLGDFYFATPRTTRKFENLSADPRVALLVNSSTNSDEDFHRAVAATVVGNASEIDGAERPAVLETYLSRHPYLEEFAKAPTSAMVRVSARSFYMVRNFQNVIELHLKK